WATYSPVLGSRSSKVSKNGSNWRCCGRVMVQKRLLSLKPAETKIKRCTFASPAGESVGLATNATRSTSTKHTYSDILRCTDEFRRIVPPEPWKGYHSQSDEPYSRQPCLTAQHRRIHYDWDKL